MSQQKVLDDTHQDRAKQRTQSSETSPDFPPDTRERERVRVNARPSAEAEDTLAVAAENLAARVDETASPHGGNNLLHSKGCDDSQKEHPDCVAASTQAGIAGEERATRDGCQGLSADKAPHSAMTGSGRSIDMSEPTGSSYAPPELPEQAFSMGSTSLTNTSGAGGEGDPLFDYESRSKNGNTGHGTGNANRVLASLHYARHPTGYRPIRKLCPSPPFTPPDLRASLPLYLAPSALPRNLKPESTDVVFKAHLQLLRRLTVDSFEAHNRYFFVYKPLARVNAVLAAAMLNIPDVDARASGALSPELRASSMYIACNAFRSVYGTAFAGQLKSVYRSSPPSAAELTDLVETGKGLDEREIAALDFAAQLSASPPVVSDATRHVLAADTTEAFDNHGLYDRQVGGIVAYAAFMSRAFGALDVELSYDAVKYASTHLTLGLQWNPAGRHFNHDSIEDIVDRDSKSHRDASRGPAMSRGSAMRKLPNLISSSVTIPRLLSEVSRVEESWMQTAWIPKSGKLLEMNDCIKSSFGFHPFYLSVSAVLDESMRRALVYGFKELLFLEGEVTRRLKFIACYVSSVCLDRASRPPPSKDRQKSPVSAHRQVPGPLVRTSVDILLDTKLKSRDKRQDRRPIERHGSLSTITDDTNLPSDLSGAPETSANLEAIAGSGASGGYRQHAKNSQRGDDHTYGDDDDDMGSSGYDSVAIITAHAAFLACRHGATTAELVAAVDEDKVREAMQRYMAQPEDDTDVLSYPIGFPLTKRDCATVLLVHAISKSPPQITAEHIEWLESSFSSSPKARGRGGRSCHRATLEIIGAVSMWALLERHCAAALTFDIDLSANLYFSGGPAEPAITDFARGPVGREIGLRLLSPVATTTPWILERSNTYRLYTSHSRHKNRERGRHRVRSTSFMSAAGLGRIFAGKSNVIRT